MTTRAVFHADPELLRGAMVGTALRVTGAEARHAVAVRRLRAGEELDLTDGAGLRATVSVVATSKDELEVTVLAVHREIAPSPQLILVQALAKGGRDEQAIEAATELGIDAVLPWQAARSVSVWSGGTGGGGQPTSKVEKGLRRWEALVRAAAKQSRRAFVPEVLPFMLTRDLVAYTRERSEAGDVVLVLHEAAEVSLMDEALLKDGERAAARVAVVVGPEGGIAEAELAELATAGARVVHAGPHVMRSSTAGPAAVAVLASRSGRWNSGAGVEHSISSGAGSLAQ